MSLPRHIRVSKGDRIATEPLCVVVDASALEWPLLRWQTEDTDEGVARPPPSPHDRLVRTLINLDLDRLISALARFDPLSWHFPVGGS